MTLEQVLAAVQLTPLLIVPVWNLCWMVSAARAGRWHSARWFARAAGTFIYLDMLVWLSGLLVGGLNDETACAVWHQQPYDAAYREARRSDEFRLFPLSNPCNAYFDLVPEWVNPLLVVFTALALVSIGGIAWALHVQTTTPLPTRGRTP